MSYKFLFSVLVASIIIYSCKEKLVDDKNADNSIYTISGKYYVQEDNQEIILHSYDPVTQVKTPLDTSSVVSTTGEFELSYEYTGPDLFRVDFPNRKYVMLAIDQGQRNIELNMEGNHIDSVFLSGSTDSEKLLAYEQFRKKSFDMHVKPAYDAMAEAGKINENPEEEIKAVTAYANANGVHRKELIEFAEKNIGTSIALFGTMLRWTGEDEVDRLDQLVANFEKVHADLPMAQKMRNKVERYKKVAIGAIAPEIAENNREGVVVKLSEARGKVTLIDFWASWCGPCLRQIPDLKEAYAEYHDEGFEIFGVSVDRREDRWKKSIDNYEMTWPNVSNLKGWGSEAAASYNVTFIPFNVLLDDKGVIIAKNLHSKELKDKLEELLN